jgi:putative Mg2+ transporter-C (MgtC) family protein
MPAWDQITTALSQEFADLGHIGAAIRVGFRLIVAAALGGALGYERETTGKAAGVRTHMLVALGSALFVLVPLETGADSHAISRVVQGLVAGIGFLGAGAIVKGRQGEEIYGLTTAAGIWTTAALGMTVALGHALTAVVATALALVILRVLPGGGPDEHGPTHGGSSRATPQESSP